MSRWPALYAGLSLLFALGAASGFLPESARAGLSASLQLGVLALVAAGAGRRLLSLAGPPGLSEPEKTFIGASLGLGILSLAVLALAGLGRLGAPSAGLALAALGLWGLAEMSPALRSLAAAGRLFEERPLGAAALAGLSGLVFWTTWIPPHQYDSLVYHLPLPQAYLRSESLAPIPGLLYSYFPQNGEMLFALALVLKSDLLAQMLMWLAAMLACWWMFEEAKRRISAEAALVSALLLLSHSSVMLLAATTYVEPLVMLWTAGAAFSFLRWREGSAGGGVRGWLALSGIFTGLALGAKYYAGITAGLLGTFLALRLLTGRREERPSRLADLGLYAGLVTALFSPWLARNAWSVGNPVFPFFYRFFEMTGTGWTAQTAEGYFRILTEYGHAGSFWRDLAALPMHLLTYGLRMGGGMDVLGGLGWELTFWLLPVGVWAGRKEGFLRGAVVFIAAYMAVWFCTGVVLRFLTVLLPLFCLLAAAGLCELWGRLGRLGRWAMGGAVGVLSAAHVFVFVFINLGVFGGGQVLWGLESREEFLSRRLDYYPCARFAAGRLDKNDRILIVGEQRGYYVEQAHAASTIHAPNRYVVWANEAATSADLARRMISEGFNKVLLSPREAARLAPALGQFTDKGYANWTGLEPKHLKLLYGGPACQLFDIQGRAGR